jgi:transcriptional regulator with XRE-family HTH domain
MVENEVVMRIAKKIRATRLEKKLTIQQLANRTRVSKGLLSKIENMRTIPSLPVFVTLIQSLDVSLRDFFKDLVLTDGQSYQLIRKEHYKDQGDKKPNGISRHHILLQNIPDSTLEAAAITLESGSRGKLSTSPGSVLVYIISGLCQFEINADDITLNEGDVLCFEGSTDHSIRSDVTTSMLQFTFLSSR